MYNLYHEPENEIKTLLHGFKVAPTDQKITANLAVAYSL